MLKLPSNFNQLVQMLNAGNLPANTFIKNILNTVFQQLKVKILSSIAEVLPFALCVAGAILVVNLGWRLFRNFTRG